MAKPTNTLPAIVKPAAKALPAHSPSIQHTVRLAHPEEMPSALDALAVQGWSLITIVACKSGQHAAYFRREN